jgi:hypothetical protein
MVFEPITAMVEVECWDPYMPLLPKTLSFACLLAGIPLTLAHAQLRTTGTAIGCASADKLQAAEEANQRHDRSLMDRLGCFPISTGTSARRVDDGKSDSLWHVILEPNGSSPMEVWGRPSSFRAD